MEYINLLYNFCDNYLNLILFSTRYIFLISYLIITFNIFSVYYTILYNILKDKIQLMIDNCLHFLTFVPL